MIVSINRILLVLWAFTFLCFRPSIFGEKYNAIVFVFFFVLSFVIILINKIPIVHKHFISYLLILVMALYFFLQGLIAGSPISIVFNSCFLIVFVSLFLVIILPKFAHEIIRSFVFIHLILSISSLITISQFFVLGLNPDNLTTLMDLGPLLGRTQQEYKYAFEGHTLYFPYSVNWASIGIGGFSIPRMLGIYREAGMAQIFFFTAYFFTYLVSFNRIKLVRTLLLLGGILTFSTSGLLSFFVGYLVLNYFPQWSIRFSAKKLLIIFIVIPVILTVLIFAPDIGILDKIASISGNQRTQSFLYSTNLFAENPLFGTGYYKGFENMERLGEEYVQFLGIIGVAYQIGIVGLVLYFLPWLYAIRYFHNKKTVFVLMPCFVTLLFSQPSYNDMIVWFLLLMDFKKVFHINTSSL